LASGGRALPFLIAFTWVIFDFAAVDFAAVVFLSTFLVAGLTAADEMVLPCRVESFLAELFFGLTGFETVDSE